jgi:hypothetical protein
MDEVKTLAMELRGRVVDIFGLLQASVKTIEIPDLSNEFIIASISAILLSTIFLCGLRSNPEKAENYSVDEPEQLKPEWKGRVLESPSIQVRLIIYI